MANRDEQKPTETAAIDAPVTMKDLLALVRELVAGNKLDVAAIAEMTAKASADVFEKVSGNWWDIRKFPNASAFNKRGDKDAPRPELVGEIYWLGYLLRQDELTAVEIGLLNQMQPGRYHDGEWFVRNLMPDVPNARKLLVAFPCKDEAARAALPRSMTVMLREIVEGVPALTDDEWAPSLSAQVAVATGTA